jgi:hypothetical protein
LTARQQQILRFALDDTFFLYQLLAHGA